MAFSYFLQIITQYRYCTVLWGKNINLSTQYELLFFLKLTLDPIPTWLLKTCIDELLPLITELINKSLSTGTFPDYFKEAIIRPPLLKKPNLDVDALKSYRPVSNLHFVSKLIEKMVMVRLERHIVHNDLFYILRCEQSLQTFKKTS